MRCFYCTQLQRTDSVHVEKLTREKEPFNFYRESKLPGRLIFSSRHADKNGEDTQEKRGGTGTFNNVLRGWFATENVSG